MELVADESVDGQLVAALRSAGHSVIYIAHLHPGAKDPEVLEFAASRNELLLTEDKDFGTLVHLHRSNHSGVILLRLNELHTPDMIARVIMVLDLHGDKLTGAFTTVDPKRIRVRRSS